MDGAGYAYSSSGYQSPAGLTLDTSFKNSLAAASSFAESSAHSYIKERDGTNIVNPISMLTGIAPDSIHSSSSSVTDANSSVTGGNLTDFTKRKNWSKRIIDELKDILHVLSP